MIKNALKLISIAVVLLITIPVIKYMTTDFSPKYIRDHLWIESRLCDLDFCSGVGIRFTDPACLLKDDGYFYHQQQPVARLSGGEKRPLFKEAAPRTGGMLEMINLKNNKKCTFDTID